jgi:hypothetical protein
MAGYFTATVDGPSTRVGAGHGTRRKLSASRG